MLSLLYIYMYDEIALSDVGCSAYIILYYAIAELYAYIIITVPYLMMLSLYYVSALSDVGRRRS